MSGRSWLLGLAGLIRAALRPFLGLDKAHEVAAYTYAVLTLVGYSFREQQRRAALGLLWLVVTPCLFLLVYLPIFSSTVDPGLSERLGGPYTFSIFVALGLITWFAFVEGIQGGAASLVANPGLVQHSPIPLSVLPFVKVLAGVTGWLVGATILLGLLVLLGRFPGLRLLLLPPTIVSFAVFVLGIALLLSAVAIVFRDLLQVLSTLLLIQFFAVPILYPPDVLSGRARMLVEANPLTPYLNMVRVTFLRDYPFDPVDLLKCAGWALLTVSLGRWVFKRMGQSFADYA